MRRIIQKLAAATLRIVSVTALMLAPATIAMAKNWADGTANWSPGTWSPAGVPTTGEAVNIVFTDGTPRTVTYNVSSLSAGLLTVDLTGAGTGASALSMPNTSTLTANGIVIGGYSGITSALTAGRGTFTQSAGTTTVNSGWDFTLGYGAGSSGTYTLSGTGALVANQSEYVGILGTGTFNQSGGTNTIATTSAFFDIGEAAGSSGTYNLSGTGTLTVKSNEYIGDIGTGVFNQTGGTHTLNSGTNLYLGYNTAGTGGTYTLSGGALVANQSEFVGYSSDSTFNQTAGSNTINASAAGIFSIGHNNTETGTYNLSGTGSLTSNADEYIGYSGLGYFTQSGGTHTVGSVATNHDLYLGYGVSGGGIYTLLGGTLAVNGSETLGYGRPSTFTQSEGTHTVSNVLSIGATPGGRGDYALSGGTLTVGGLENIAGGGSVGNTFSQTGGTHTVGDPASRTGLLALAPYLNSNASYSLTSGNLTVNGAEHVGGLGAATFTQSGGTNTIVSGSDPYVGLYLGTGSGGSGTYSLSGNGILSVTGDAYIGGSVAAPGGTGVMNLNGGTGTMTGTMKVWNTVGTAVNLAGATLSVGSLDTDSNPSRFNWTAGALNLTNSNLTIGSAGSLGTSLTIDSAKALSVSGTTTIDPLRALTLSGGSFSTAILVNRGTFTYPSALFNGRLLNQGTVNLGPIFTAANGVQNDVTMTVVVGQTLTANGAGFDNRGTLSFNDVTAVLAGTSLNNTGLVRGEGLVTAPFNNNPGGEVRAETGKWLKFQSAGGPNAGRISLFGGTLEFTQPLTNGAAGQILGNGTLIVGGTGLTNQGQLIFSSGVGYVFGKVNNNTSNATKGVTITGNSNVTFWDDVTQAAGALFKVQTGSSATFFGTLGGAGNITGGGDVYLEADLTPGSSPASVSYDANVHFDSAAELKIELGGTSPGTMYDQVHVSGQLSLDGTLQVLLINGFTPAAGQAFDILDWGSHSGMFNTIALPALTNGLQWNTSQLYTTGVLSVASAGLPGDYNHDGIVDAADYVVWRKGLGTTFTQADYGLWRAHFGQIAGIGAGASAAIPEPAAIVLMLISGIGIVPRRIATCRASG